MSIHCSFKVTLEHSTDTTSAKGGSRVGERRGKVEAQQAPRGRGAAGVEEVGLGEGVSPFPTGEGSGEGAVPPPQNFFGIFIPKWRISVHSAAVILG